MTLALWHLLVVERVGDSGIIITTAVSVRGSSRVNIHNGRACASLNFQNARMASDSTPCGSLSRLVTSLVSASTAVSFSVDYYSLLPLVLQHKTQLTPYGAVSHFHSLSFRRLFATSAFVLTFIDLSGSMYAPFYHLQPLWHLGNCGVRPLVIEIGCDRTWFQHPLCKSILASRF